MCFDYFSRTCNQGWPYYLYITCLYTLFRLDELILLHISSFSFVVYVVWGLFIVFDHMIMILKSHVFYCKDQKNSCWFLDPLKHNWINLGI